MRYPYGDRRGAKGLGMQVGAAQGQRATGPTAGLEGAKDSEGLEGAQDSEGSDPAPPIATHRYSYALIVDGRQIEGILTERDLVRLLAQGVDPKVTLVRSCMTRQIVLLKPHQVQDVIHCINLMQQHQIRHLPVTDGNGQVLGCVTATQVRQFLRPVDLLKYRQVGEVMVTKVFYAVRTAPVMQIIQIMARCRVSCVVVVDPDPRAELEGELEGGAARGLGAELEGAAEHGEGAAIAAQPLLPIGIITERDIVQLQLLGLDFHTTLAEEIMSTPLFLMSPTDSLWAVQQEMARCRVRRFVVANAMGQMVGLVTQSSILNAINPVELFQMVALLQDQVQSLKAQQQEILATQTSEMEERQHWEQLLATLALRIRQSLNLDEILQTAATEVRQLLGVDRILFYHLNEQNQGQVVVEAVSDDRWRLLEAVVPDDCFRQEWVEHYRLGRVTAIESVADAPLDRCHRQMLQRFQVQAKAGVPIQQGEKLWGLLIAHHCQEPRRWQAGELRFLQQMGVQVGIALQQSALVDQLREAKESLEAKVAERTQTLAEANQKLFKSLKEREQITLKIQQREAFWRNILNALNTFVGVLTPEVTIQGSTKLVGFQPFDRSPKQLKPYQSRIFRA
ncbi:MAG: CBS domain-containing protein [Prochlorothrix sp.]